jgi:hypothetical protein
MIGAADRDHIVAFLLIPLVIYALFALVSPAVFVHGFGRPRQHRAPIREAILRVASVLILISAAIMWWRVWGP